MLLTKRPVAVARALAAMPNAAEGGHIASAPGGRVPGLGGMAFAGLRLPGQLGPRHRGLVGVLLGHPVPQRGVLLPAVVTAVRTFVTIAWALPRLLAASVAFTVCW